MSIIFSLSLTTNKREHNRRKKTVGKLLEEPSFQMESVAFLAGNPPVDLGGGGGGVSGVPHSTSTPMFSFEKCK